jgi:hypothetical protein
VIQADLIYHYVHVNSLKPEEERERGRRVCEKRQRVVGEVLDILLGEKALFC